MVLKKEVVYMCNSLIEFEKAVLHITGTTYSDFLYKGNPVFDGSSYGGYWIDDNAFPWALYKIEIK